jgi:hypothetical protein
MNRILFAVTLASSLLMSPATRSLLLDQLSALWSKPLAKAGCGADPNGLCTPVPQPQPETDAGCGADPWGCPKGS